MDGITEVLEAIRDGGLAAGRLRGVFHLAIGRRLSRPDGTVLSAGVTWRQLAELLRVVRFDKDLAREVGVDPDTTSPRDRERMWYTAIALSGVDSPAARTQAEDLAGKLKPLGYVVGPAPTGRPSPSHPPAKPKPEPPATEKKKKKK